MGPFAGNSPISVHLPCTGGGIKFQMASIQQSQTHLTAYGPLYNPPSVSNLGCDALGAIKLMLPSGLNTIV